ncbi:hypothetical protein SAMN05216337_1017142 [Bradyrhizobium brasilense]|uniref:Uncharacterized protein n=1 Tax=Bradyrhizobium brasilense TaxID=1419277 RepID=A0A1G6YYK4_9BRAD|nr:hypothetical protein [Bradyrhizobium brasilense]SDD95342.1 hypothetical protein SAMN05216337_1017142 [Bradyrhizobium brasilense]
MKMTFGRFGLIAVLGAALYVGGASAQLPPGNGVVINQTPVAGGSSGQCLFINNGKISSQACASGGTPGGTSGQIQYNNAGAFGGFTASGDATINTGTGGLTLATVNTNTGTWGGATQCAAVTVNGKGLITAAAQSACTPAVANLTGLGTGVATALGTAVGSAGGPVTNGGVLGTPSSGNASNLTALNASQLTSGTVPNGRIPTAAFQNTVTNPTGTTSTSGVMMGAGSVCAISPGYSGRVKFEIIGSTSNTTAGATNSVVARYGTGTAPANGAAPAGTALGNFIAVNNAAGFGSSFTSNAIASGLAIGTPVWFDIELVVSAGTGTVVSVSCNAMEF